MRVLVLIMALGLLVGCSGRANEDLQQFMETERQMAGGRIEPLPALPPFESVVYSAAGIRSPFEIPQTIVMRQETGQATSAPDMSRPREFLERFNVAEISMVGSIYKDSVQWGLVTDSTGAVHRVRVGNYLGKNYGQITHIEETLIEILEKVPDGQGGWIERPRTLNMNFSP